MRTNLLIHSRLYLVLISSTLAAVTNTSDLSAQLWGRSEAVKKIMAITESYDKSVIKESYGVKAYFQEELMKDGRYVGYSNALGLLLSHGHNCPIPVNSFSFNPLALRKSDKKPSWLVYLRNHESKPPPTDFQPEYVNLLSAYRWFEMNGPLNKGSLKNFDFKEINAHALYFNSKSSEYSPRTYYEGTIFYNFKTNLVDSIHVKRGRWYSEQHQEVVFGWLTIAYNYHNGKCWPSSIKGGYRFDGIELLASLQVKSSKPSLINTFDEKMEYFYLINSSRCPLVNYNRPLWESSSFRNIKNKGRIEGDLEVSSLEEQFIANDQKPFFKYTLPDGSIGPYIDCITYTYSTDRINKLEKLID